MQHLVTGMLAAGAMVLVALALPLVLRRVRPNGLYGFRTPSTLGDERLWYEVNAKTGVDLLLTGAGLLGIAIARLLGFIGERPFPVVALAWLFVGVLVSVVHGFAIIGRRRR